MSFFIPMVYGIDNLNNIIITLVKYFDLNSRLEKYPRR
jgi:hypothetical protein